MRFDSHHSIIPLFHYSVGVKAYRSLRALGSTLRPVSLAGWKLDPDLYWELRMRFFIYVGSLAVASIFFYSAAGMDIG